ncbi:MAG: peptidyl-prolyl cis-trans isomerase [Candidatus Edwardsbacteria bacterium]|nr:peptidyl-prolyl cis-trans isomerase [Candidatus Edwardsbacteria bacterium]
MKRILSSAALAALCLLAISCSRSDRVIARVGSQKLTIGEFEQFYQPPVMAQDTAEVASGKRRALDQMVEEKLLLCEALARGYDKEPQTVRELNEIRNNVLLDWLYREEFLKKNLPTESAVKDLYKRLGIQIRVRHILTRTGAEAREMIDAIRDKKAFDRAYQGKTFDEEILMPDPSSAGGPAGAAAAGQIPPGMRLEKRTVRGATQRERFMIVARERSQEEMTAVRGGDISWFGWGQIAPGFEAFQEAAFKLKPGQMSAPVKTPAGYHVIMVDSAKKTDLPPYAQAKDQLKTRLEQQAFAKAGEQAQHCVIELLGKAKITLDTTVAAMLAEKQQQQYGAGICPFPQLDPEDLKRAVATYKGGALTCRDLADGAAFFFRGSLYLASADSIRKYVERMVSRALLAERARSLGLERLPKVKRHIALKSMDKLAGLVYRREVQDKIDITDATVAQYYQNNRREFFQPAQAYVDLIAVKSRPEAGQVADELRKSNGVNFAAVAREKSLDPSRQSGGYLGPITRDNAAYPEVAARAFSIPLGASSEPFPAKGGYAVIKVSKRDQARQQEFDEVKDRIRGILTQRQNDLLFKNLTTFLKGKYSVTVDDKTLAAAGQRKEKE